MMILCLAALLVLPACVREAPPAELNPPPTPFLTSGSQWGVANKAYLKVLAGPELSSEVTGFLRRGDLAEVITKIGEPDGSGYWLEIRLPNSSETGWIRNVDLNVYDTKPQARTAGDALGGE